MAALEEVKTICIIGAGAAGLAVLRTILDTSPGKAGLWKPTVFEARDRVGGIWLPDSTPSDPSTSVPPQTPLYDSLTTNLPHPVMCFPSFSFPPSTPVFPSASHVQIYLESYAGHFNLLPFIQLKTLIVDVRWDSGKWKIQDEMGRLGDLEFDLVIVANGHHSIPRYPNVPGIETWLAARKALHSLWYRNPKFLGNKVLVVGGGPSGSDISAEMSTACRTLIRSVSGAPNQDNKNIKIRGRTTKFGANGEVYFQDGSVERDVDYCILATGYQVSIPFLSDHFLRSGIPPPCPPLPSTLYNSTYHIFPIADHVFPIQSDFPSTSLVFMGLPVRVAPLPLMEAQAAAIVHAFANPASLDVERESRDLIVRYEQLGAPFDGNPAAIARIWSIFEEQEQFDYQDRLFEFAGKDICVPQWRKDMYHAKDLLRSFWVELERRGEADDWVRGVGEGGADEWVNLLQRLLKSAQEWESTTSYN